MDSPFTLITSLLIGVSLAASCGFRVFVPLLVMSCAVKGGMLELTEGWAWIGSWPALIAFLVASILEAAGFFIPWVANLLDTVATPAAVVAGIIATAACVAKMDPLLQWATAIVAGGGLAAAIRTATVGTRWTSTLTTGGLGDFVVAAGELAMSLVMSILAILAPILAAAIVCVVAAFVIRLLIRMRRKRALSGGT